MTDMLKVAEAKAVDVIVKKGAKSKKQSKIPTKASKIPKDPTVTKKTNKKTKPTKQSKLNDVEDNDYLKMCSEKQKKNTDRLNSIAQDLQELKKAKKTSPSKRTTRISIKTGAKKKKCKIDHSDVGMFKEEPDKRYCSENGDLHGAECTVCEWEFKDSKNGDTEEVGVFVPSVKCPIYVCSGRTLHDCTYSLCNNCYVERSNAASRSRKRSRRN